MHRVQLWKVAVATVLILALAVTLLALFRVSGAAADIAVARKSRMFESQPAGSLVQFKSAVLTTPLQADLVHGLISHRVKQRKAEALDETERKALLSLGWRSTLVQTALLLDSIARGDEGLALSRIDGILRRGVNKPELLRLMVKLEQAGPGPRREIVRMLAAGPNWRTDFFSLPAGYDNTAGLLARAETLNSMFVNRLAPRRDEVAPIVNRLEATDDTQRAERIWRQFHGVETKAALPFDPMFIHMAAYSIEGQDQVMVYEWRGGQGAGYSARANRIGPETALLTVRWDGRGAPVLLRQRLIAKAGYFAVTVKGPLLDRSALQRLAFAFYCKGSAPIFHDRLTQDDKGSFVFTANEAVSCRSPEVRLVGMSEESVSPLEIQIDLISVALTQNAASTTELGNKVFVSQFPAPQ